MKLELLELVLESQLSIFPNRSEYLPWSLTGFSETMMPYPVRAALFPHRMPKPSSFSLCLQNRGRSLGESQLLLEKKLMNNVGKGSSYCFQAGIDCLFHVLERLQNRTYL